MSEQEFLDSLATLRLIAMLESLEAGDILENIRVNIAALKCATDKLDHYITPTLTVGQLLTIPQWDADREIVSDVITSYLADLVSQAAAHCGLDPNNVPIGVLVVTGLMLEPIQNELVNSLIPLH